MTDNEQRAAGIIAAWTTGSKPWSALTDFVAAALDAAEARGRAEAIEHAAGAVEALRPHIPPSTDPDRRSRIVQRSSFNRAASAVRASAGELS